jgi:hypothetical protein
MEQPEFKSRLIHNKRGAVIAVFMTAYVAGLSFRNVLSHSQRNQHWLLDLDWLVLFHFTLPAWAVAGINLGFYACLFWGAVVLYRIAQGKERVLIVGGFAVIFLGLIQHLVSASEALAIDYIKAIATLAAFLAAVDIFFRMPASGYPRVDNQTFRNT